MASVFAGITLDKLDRIEAGDTTVPLVEVMNLAYIYGMSPVQMFPGLALAPQEALRFDHADNPQSQKRVRAFAAAAKARRQQ